MDEKGLDGQTQMLDQHQHQGGCYWEAQDPHQQQEPRAFKWPGYDQPMNYAQPQAYTRQDHNMQLQHYAPPMQLQPQAQQSQQHAHVYTRQEQVWPSNNGWSRPHRTHQGTSTGSDEEDWAAKARAWAAAKAAQEAAQQCQLQTQGQAQVPFQTGGLHQEQSYQDYRQQLVPQTVKHSEPAQQSPVLPPGQGLVQGFAHDVPPSFTQDERPCAQDLPAFGQDGASPSFGQDGSTLGYPKAPNTQVVSSFSHNATSSYGQHPAITAPPGMEQEEHSNQKPPHTSASLFLPQLQKPHLPAQVSPQTQHKQFPCEDCVQPPAFEFHQHLQFDYQQPPGQDYQLQPPAPYLPPVPSTGIDVSEMNFGGNPVWPPPGGPGMPFPPSMGPGGPGNHPGPQFDHRNLNLNHHHHLHPLHCHQRPKVFPGMHGVPHHATLCPPVPAIGTAFEFSGIPALGQGPGGVGPVFLPDGHGNMGPSDRPKKAPVPSWLREELLKKKATVSMLSSALMSMSDDFMQIKGSETRTAAVSKMDVSHEKTRSGLSGISDNDEDDEDDTEAEKTATMNQEIKRVLTEVLLKVTDELFEEIVEEVVDEGAVVDGQREYCKSVAAQRLDIPGSRSCPSPPVCAPPARVLVAPLKQNKVLLSDDDSSDHESSGAPVGNVLGLATYASDEDLEQGESEVSASIGPETSMGEQRRTEKKEDRRNHQKVRMNSCEDLRKKRKSYWDGNKSGLTLEEEDISKEQENDNGDIAKERKDKERVEDNEGRGQEQELAPGNDEKKQRSKLKGRKCSNEERNCSHQNRRSLNQALDEDVELFVDDLTFFSGGDKVFAEPSLNKIENSRHHIPDLKKEKQSGSGLRATLNTLSEAVDIRDRASSTVRGQSPSASTGKMDVNIGTKQESHNKESKVHRSCAVQSVGTKTQMEYPGIFVGRISRESEDRKQDGDGVKHFAPEREQDEENADRIRGATKAQIKDQDKENDWIYEKEKPRSFEREAGLGGERGKERGVDERDSRKGDRDRSRMDVDMYKEPRDSRSNRQGPSSVSRWERSQKRSGCTRSSSSAGDRSKSPKQRRPTGSHSRSPPSKYSHRRNSPSPSRDSERYR